MRIQQEELPVPILVMSQKHLGTFLGTSLDTLWKQPNKPTNRYRQEGDRSRHIVTGCHLRWQGLSETRKEILVGLIWRWQVHLAMTCLFPGFTSTIRPSVHCMLHWPLSKRETWRRTLPWEVIDLQVTWWVPLETLERISSVQSSTVFSGHTAVQSGAVTPETGDK